MEKVDQNTKQRKHLFQKLILEQDWLSPSNYQNTNIYNTNSQTPKNIYVSSKCLRLQVRPVPSGRWNLGLSIWLVRINKLIVYPFSAKEHKFFIEGTQVLSVRKPRSSYRTSPAPAGSPGPFSARGRAPSSCAGRRLTGSCPSAGAFSHWQEKDKHAAYGHYFWQFLQNVLKLCVRGVILCQHHCKKQWERSLG